ncbi:hypothetical protein GCM10010273_19240 [Streptomyces lavendulocolor]
MRAVRTGWWTTEIDLGPAASLRAAFNDGNGVCYEQQQGPAGQPTSTNAFLDGNRYRTPDGSRFSGMHVIDMRMHMNFGDARNAFHNGKDSDGGYHDATYIVVYVDSHDYGPTRAVSATRAASPPGPRTCR